MSDPTSGLFTRPSADSAGALSDDWPVGYGHEAPGLVRELGRLPLSQPGRYPEGSEDPARLREGLFPDPKRAMAIRRNRPTAIPPADFYDIYLSALWALTIGGIYAEHERRAIELVILLRELQTYRNKEQKHD